MKQDVRQPATPGDFETSVQRAPRPPYRVTSVGLYTAGGGGTGLRTLEIYTDETSIGRESTTSYRIYYLPANLTEITPANFAVPGFLAGAGRAAIPVGSVEASSDTITRFVIPDGPGVIWGSEGKGGWWVVRAVNRYGQMSEPSIPVPDAKVPFS